MRDWWDVSSGAGEKGRRGTPEEGGEVHAHAQKDAGEVGMLFDLLLFTVILVCASVWFWIGIRLLLPVVWQVIWGEDIKLFIREMLGPRR